MYDYILGVVTSYADGSLPPGARRWHPGANGMGPLSAWRHDLQLLVYVRGVRTVSALGRGPSWFVCDREEVVIGPANHCYIWVTSTKE
jgi:hypothetical protein